MAILKELVVNGDASVVGTLNATAERANSIVNNISQNGTITISTSDPSGGSNGDIWLKYEE